MLEQLRIKNFKGWEDTGQLDLKPITLFFGANSSGKSSLGQFLMMLKQTVESPDRKAVFHPGGKQSAVELGSFRHMVYQRDITRSIAFDYRWSLPETFEFRDPNAKQTQSANALSFQAKVELSDHQRQAMVVDQLNYDLYENGQSPMVSIGMQRAARDKSIYEVPVSNYELRRTVGRPKHPGSPVRFYGFPDEVVAYYQNADFVQALNLQHEKLFRSMYYLGPMRTRGERMYTWTGTEPESVGYSGEQTITALLAAKNREISNGFRKRSKPFEVVIAQALKTMNLIEDFEVKPITPDRQTYEVKIRTKGSNDTVDLPDVGFGISQVLPVLVQCYYAPPGSIIIMEQPEIHLHPSAQSALADVMLDVIQSRENGADRNIQLIIETHSEHFLRRLQRRIAEDEASNDLVAAYFANITKTPATLEALALDDYGNIRNWPEHFFGDEMGDIAKQAEAAVRKRMQRVASE